jgi:hypothetical protein
VVTAPFGLFGRARWLSSTGIHCTWWSHVSKLENRSIEDKFIGNTEVFEHPFRSLLLPGWSGRAGTVDNFLGL